MAPKIMLVSGIFLPFVPIMSFCSLPLFFFILSCFTLTIFIDCVFLQGSGTTVYTDVSRTCEHVHMLTACSQGVEVEPHFYRKSPQIMRGTPCPPQMTGPRVQS